MSKIQSEIRSENYNRKKPSSSGPGNFLEGSMLFFGYDPKTKKELPFWDAFPLIIVLKKRGGSLLGLNLHYLEPMLRAKFLNALLRVVDDPDYIRNPNAKFQITYAMLKSASNMRVFRACIKRYMISCINTKVNQVPSNEWKYTVFMPLEKFKGASRDEVWKWANRYK